MRQRKFSFDGFEFTHTEGCGWEVWWNGFVALHAGDSDEELMASWPEEKAAIIKDRMEMK